MINFGHNSHYVINNRVFHNKTLALLYANESNIPSNDIVWKFHDDEFNSIDWTIEPSLSINEFYRQRALSIRQKYDYVILMCSGGPDSTNMAYSFLRNGIHVDEIVASAPMSGLSNWKNDPNDQKTENTISETKLAQIPFVNEIHDLYPHIKITINDYFEDMLSYKDSDWLIKSTDYIHPTTVARYALEKFPHLQKLAETDKKVGVVYGIDKPTIFIEKDKIYNMIVDYAVNTPTDNDFKNFYNELFYFSHEMPQLVVKQCHMLKKWLFLPENSRALALTKLNGQIAPTKEFNAGLYQRAIVPCIYPMIEKKIWQAGKPNYNILANMDMWFYKKHNSLRVYDMMTHNINSIINTIRDDLFQYKFYRDLDGNIIRYRSGLKLFHKKFYIGSTNEK